MVQDPYSGYSYTRKRFKKFRLFAYVFITTLIVFILLTSNLFLGFFKSSEAKRTFTVPEINFWAEEVDAFTTKASALQSSHSNRQNGGAGYLVASNKWLVLESVYASQPEKENIRQFTCPSVDINLSAPEHAVGIEKITSSFINSFKVLCNQQSEFQANTLTADAVSMSACNNYNEIQKLYAELNQMQELAQNSSYAKIMLYTNKQLLALYILSTKNTGPDFLSDIKLAACSIIFAYYDLIVDLQSGKQV